MANLTLLRGACEAPFLQLSNFPSKDGYLPGRFCAPVPSLQGPISCCLPCPMTDWVYSDDFTTLPTVSNWLNVVGMVCTISLLLSFAVLPVERTSRHYLTVGLVLAVCVLQLGFIIPLGAQPQLCHDAITPNDMYSDLTCAFSGASLVVGGFAIIVWGFLRSLSLHLQICWQVVLGQKFFWFSFLAGWGIPVVFAAATLATTGVSYRFGETCHINHSKALQDYWCPLLAFAAVSTILQFVTFGYCVKVYLRSLFNDESTGNSSGLPSYNGSITKVSAKVAYGRVRKVMALQWRGIMIVLIIVANVVFLAVVFVKTDNTERAAVQNLGKAEPWLLCLVLNPTNKAACLDKARGLGTKESTVMAVLILLSLNGIWTLLFLGRMSMVYGWMDLLHGVFKRSHDFVSVDARRVSTAPHDFEMISRPTYTYNPKSADPRITSVSSDGETDTIMELSPSSKTDLYANEKAYVTPSLSFSTPRPPSSGRRNSTTSRTPSVGKIEGFPSRQSSLVRPQGREWDPSATHAKPLRSNSGFSRI